MSGDSQRDDFNKDRAELFEALGHPTRINILQVLSKSPLGFSELKKETGIESNGLLSFHLNKLGGLVKAKEGSYALTDDGREALRVSTVRELGGGLPRTRLRGVRPIHAVGVAVIVILALSTYLIYAMYTENQQLNSAFSSLNQSYFSLSQSFTELSQKYNVEFGDVQLSCNLKDLSLHLTNRGGLPITSVTMELDGAFIPFASGVTDSNRLYPGQELFLDFPPSWLDLDSNATLGITESGFSLQNGSCSLNNTCIVYPLTVKIAFSDGVRITEQVNAIVRPGGCVELFSPVGSGVDIRDAGLFRMEDGRGLIALSMQNVWGNFSNVIYIGQCITSIPISGFTVLLDGETVASFQFNLSGGDWLAISKAIPSGLEVGKVYELQVQVWSSDGRSATNTMSFACEPA